MTVQRTHKVTGRYTGPTVSLGDLREMMREVEAWNDEAEVRITVQVGHQLEGGQHTTTIEVTEK